MTILIRNSALFPLWATVVSIGVLAASVSQAADPQTEGPAKVQAEAFRPIPGSLVIAGGGGLPAEITQRFLELGGGEQTRLVVVTTASIFAGTEEMDSRMGYWREKKLASLDVLHTRSRDEANDPDFYRPLDRATAVWFIGGNQNWLTDAYLGTRTETKFHDVLKRGGVLGGTSAGAAIMSRIMISGGKDAALLRSGFGFAPGLIVDQHFRKRNRQQRLIDALAHWPGHLGMGIDEATALVIRGGIAEVVGLSDVTITLGAAPGRPFKAESLSPGKTADLVALSRAASARRPSEDWAKRRARKGTLMLIGQGTAPEEIRQQFLRAAGGNDAPIVVVCSAEKQDDAERDVCQWLRSAGASNVRTLPARSRQEAESPEFLTDLTKAKGIWLSDGPIRKLIDTYVDGPMEPLLERLLDQGGVIAGSAAGAALQGEAFAAATETGELEVMTEAYEHGFGFLPGVAVTQGDPTPNPTAPMSGLKARYPYCIGLELNDSTALVVQGSKMQVVGKHPVTVLDRQPMDPMDHPEFSLVNPGQFYDFSERKLAAAVDSAADR